MYHPKIPLPYYDAVASYLPTANTTEIRSRLYNGAVQLGSLTGFSYLGPAVKTTSSGRSRVRTLTFKIVVLGDSGTGKTSLIARYLENRDIELKPMPTQYGEYYTRKFVLGERKVGIQVWDVPSHILNSDMNDECFLQKSFGAIIVYDFTKRSSFENVENYVRKFRRYAHPGAMCVLLANKKDLQAMSPHSFNSSHNSTPTEQGPSLTCLSDQQHQLWVTTAEGRQFADGYSMGFVEASAYTGTNVQEAFNSLLMALNDAANDYYAKIEIASTSSSTTAEG